MKAIEMKNFGTSENLQLAELPLPAISATDVIVKLHAAGVNPSDVYTSTGTYAIKPQLPYTPGLDGAGIVEAVGEAVTNVQVGDRVFVASLPGATTGTFAEAVVCDANYVMQLPEHISFLQGAALGIPALTAFRAVVQKADVQANQTVLIHGASGAVGLQAVQMAKSFGATVIGTASRGEGKALVKDAGADYAFDHITEGNLEQILEVTEGAGPDVIIEFLANVNLAIDLQMVAKYGKIVIVGNRGDIEINPRLIMQKECDITGMVLFNATGDQHRELMTSVAAMLEENKLTPFVGHSYPLAQAGEAFEAVMAGRHNGKVVLQIL
ncbi:NADPH:quinone reductase [Solibacillus sp. MA9]|uniref:NADPH:quinone reductase n=1 Tax=Solibacillus palustris TaxID=2908203 RepID=A0ABS9UAT1_9BACL|nr:NADPH:quinone reductase [Solibacillus sp. MA9]MCH7321452.1 NADPH:quinone reductase [Solibacillus sp. MA9]